MSRIVKDSGIGPEKIIKGNVDAGYFGLVNTDITKYNIGKSTKLDGPYQQGNYVGESSDKLSFYKFIYTDPQDNNKNKIILFATETMWAGIPDSVVYNKYIGRPNEKNPTIEIDGYEYKIRTFSGYSGKYESPGVFPSYGCEWDDLLVKLHPGDIKKHSYLKSWSYNSGYTNASVHRPSSDVGSLGTGSAMHYPHTEAWTPVLELVNAPTINEPPTIKLETTSGIKLYEGSQVDIKGTVSDKDVGDVVTVKYKVNNSSIRNIKAYVSQGTEEAFSKVLTYKNGSLYDGATLVIANLIDGNHTITVWAEDNNGGKSEEHKITIITKRNRPPELTITDYPQDLQGLITTDKLTVTGTASDPDDGAILTVTAQINNDEPQTIPIEDGEWSFSFAVKQLNEGDNILTFEVADQYGATDKKKVKLTNIVHASPAPISVARYKLDTPEPITDLIMWIKHKADADIKAYASIVQEGQPDNYVEMTRTEGTSPTGVLESEFTYSVDVAGANAKVKIVNADQAMVIMGGMSNNAES